MLFEDGEELADVRKLDESPSCETVDQVADREWLFAEGAKVGDGKGALDGLLRRRRKSRDDVEVEVLGLVGQVREPVPQLDQAGILAWHEVKSVGRPVCGLQ